jgi:hypothetical protein
MAPTPRSARQQRARWERGHYITLLKQTLRLLQSAFRQKRFELFLLGMEILVPPLTSLVLLLGFFFAIALIASFFGLISVGFVFWSGGLVAILASIVLIAWAHFGQNMLQVKDLFLIPLYFIWKIPIYIELIFSRQKKWEKTDRK